jgi:hypothetical protein
MTKLRIAVVAAVVFALVAAVAAEAYKTTAEEGRKFSRKYAKQFYGDNWKQRECWRVGPNGVGRAGWEIARRGVVCRFSFPTKRNAYCRVLAVAVKDKRPEGRLTAEEVEQLSPQEVSRDAAWCDGEPGGEAPPKPEGATKYLSGS